MHTDDEDWKRKYLSLIEQKTARLRAMPQSRRDGLRAEWARLQDEIRASLDEDPAGPRAQALVDRWLGLVNEFGVVDDSVVSLMTEGARSGKLKRFTEEISDADRARVEAVYKPTFESGAFAFVQRALAARNR